MAMNKEKKKKIWIVVIAVAILLLIVQPGGIMNTSTNIKNLVAKLTGAGGTINANLGNPDVDFLSVRLYDKDGNLIKSPETFSTVCVGAGCPASGQTVKGVYYMDYTVMVDASSSGTDISCTLDSVTPIPMAATSNCGPSGTPTISPTTLNIVAGSKQTWTSARMNVPGTGVCNLETAFPVSPVNSIIATVSCKYCDEGDCTKIVPGSPKTGLFAMVITPAGAAGYTVEVTTGGLPTEYCGDSGLPGGGCQSPLENANNCPIDCSLVGKAAFRSSDLSYVSGSAIAWNGLISGASCPTAALTRYGYTSTGCWAQTDATCPTAGSAAAYTLKTFTDTSPLAVRGASSWATGSGCLYQKTADSTEMVIAFKQTTGGVGPCATSGQWGTIAFDSDDADKSKVSSSSSGWDLAKEVACSP